MRKFFAVLGVVFLIVIVLGAIGFGYIAYRGSALDKENKAYGIQDTVDVLVIYLGVYPRLRPELALLSQ